MHAPYILLPDVYCIQLPCIPILVVIAYMRNVLLQLLYITLYTVAVQYTDHI